jgi:TRAP-type mannitol/chloroaromatic compound transport system permease small subunit
MFDLKNLLLGLSWALYLAWFIAAAFALRETRHLPLKSFMPNKIMKEVPQKFFFYMGLAFLFLVPASLIEGAYSTATCFALMSLQQFCLKNYFIDRVTENRHGS